MNMLEDVLIAVTELSDTVKALEVSVEAKFAALESHFDAKFAALEAHLDDSRVDQRRERFSWMLSSAANRSGVPSISQPTPEVTGHFKASKRDARRPRYYSQ